MGNMQVGLLPRKTHVFRGYGLILIAGAARQMPDMEPPLKSGAVLRMMQLILNAFSLTYL